MADFYFIFAAAFPSVERCLFRVSFVSFILS